MPPHAQKAIINVEVARIVPWTCPPQQKQDIKCTLQADHRNGECGGWENCRHAPRPGAKTDIKCTLQTDHGNGGKECSTGTPAHTLPADHRNG